MGGPPGSEECAVDPYTAREVNRANQAYKEHMDSLPEEKNE